MHIAVRGGVVSQLIGMTFGTLMELTYVINVANCGVDQSQGWGQSNIRVLPWLKQPSLTQHCSAAAWWPYHMPVVSIQHAYRLITNLPPPRYVLYAVVADHSVNTLAVVTDLATGRYWSTMSNVPATSRRYSTVSTPRYTTVTRMKLCRSPAGIRQQPRQLRTLVQVWYTSAYRVRTCFTWSLCMINSSSTTHGSISTTYSVATFGKKNQLVAQFHTA